MYDNSDKAYKVIGICVSAVQQDSTRDVVNALCRKAYENNYKVLLFNSFSDFNNKNYNSRAESSVFSLADSELLSAVILLPESIKNNEAVDRIVEAAKRSGKPVIAVDGTAKNCTSIVYNCTDTFEQIVRHVVKDHGCKRINFLAGIKGNAFSEERVDCFKKVLAENDIEFEPQRLGYGDFWDVPARRAVEGFLESGLPLPEAIVCCNDTMALTACQVLREHGHRVPEDVIVTGFDGIDVEKYVVPRLTTAAADIDLLAETAIKTIGKLLLGEAVDDITEVPYNIRISQSCGCKEIETRASGDKVIELINIINRSEGHETHMLNYLGKAVGCSSLEEIGSIIPQYGDHCAWCCLNTDFLDEVPKDKNDFFTDEMYNLVRYLGNDYICGGTFPKTDLLPDICKAIESYDFIMFSPLHFQNEVIGYLAVVFGVNNFNFKNTKRFVDYTNQIMENLKNRIFLKRANAQLADMHMRDSLTGIYNRRGFYKHAEEVIKKCSSDNKNIVLFSIDMDGLKKINDSYGHHDGDKAITAISDSLRKASHNGEICSRFGGDEFVVLAAAADGECERYIADFSGRVETLLDEYNETSGAAYKVRISCGSTVVKCTAIDDIDNFINIADENMYRQKRMHKMLTGENKISHFSRMVDLLINKSSTAFFYINYDERSWEIAESKAVLKCMESDKFDPVEAILKNGFVFRDDTESYRALIDKVKKGVADGIPDNYIKTQFRVDDGETVKWYAMVLSFVKNEKNQIYETVGSIHAMTEQELMSRNILNSYTNDRQPKLFAELMENRLRSDTANKYAVIQFDVVKFKVINDKYGEPTGTEILNYFNDVLNVFCSENQLHTRLSADVFMILTPYSEVEDIIRFIRALEKRMSGYKGIKYEFAFGVYLVGDRNIPSRKMGDSAAIARIKIKGNALENIGFFTDNQRQEIVARKEIEDRMRSALENREFVMYLQPKYSISENIIIGSEALVRWMMPGKGMIPPNSFIPVFEQNGFIVKLDEYIWECACVELRKWIDLGFEPLPISVNVSRVHLKDHDFIGRIEALVQKYGIDKRLLELEITETIDNINSNAMVREAKEHGFTLLMDDFGSGYSSLNTLKSTPFDVLKIDRSFLNSFMESERGQKIISHTISMSKDIGLDLVAEGVETREQADFLSGCGCDAAQGFYYSKAIPVEDFEKLLRAQENL
ncbi:MAG: EAL domain-containing protein [Oscillospiraceae bacterium]